MNVKRLTIKDSKNNESKILFIAVISWFVMLVKFLLAEITLPFDMGSFPAMGAGEFGGATAALIAVIAARKWINANAEPGEQPAE